jgi:hypothetical protein
MKTKLIVSTGILGIMSVTGTLMAQEMPADLTKLMVLEGKWEGNATAKMGEKSYNFSLHSEFTKLPGGSGLTMHEWAEIPDMGKFDGTNLIGFDPYDKKIHWYTVDNMGTTHEHVGLWKNDKEFYMEHQSQREGKKFVEQISTIFTDPKTVSLSIKETLDGQPQFVLDAKLTKKM